MTSPAEPGQGSNKRSVHDGVAKAAVLSIAAIASGIATIITASGMTGIPSEVTMYSLGGFFGLACVALLVGALYVWVNRSSQDRGR